MPDIRDLLVGVRRDADRAPLPCTAHDRRWWWSVRQGGCSTWPAPVTEVGGVTFLVMDEADQMLDRGFCGTFNGSFVSSG